ncbi:MAG: phage tail tube protein [Candidatus Caldarchaeum sp.]
MPAKVGYGTLLKMGDGGSPENFATVAGVSDITLPGVTLDVVDVTSQETNGWREKLATLKDPGEVTFEVFFDLEDPTHGNTNGLLKKAQEGKKINWKVVFQQYSPAKEWSFSGYITRFEPQSRRDNALTAAVTIAVVGQPTFA